MPPLQRSNSRVSKASTAYRYNRTPRESWIPAKHCGQAGWQATQDQIKSHHNTLLDEYIETMNLSDVDHTLVWRNLTTTLKHEKAPNASETRHESIVEVETNFNRANTDAVKCTSFKTIWRCGGKCPPWLVYHPPRPRGGPSLAKSQLPTEEQEKNMTQDEVNWWWNRFSNGTPITEI